MSQKVKGLTALRVALVAASFTCLSAMPSLAVHWHGGWHHGGWGHGGYWHALGAGWHGRGWYGNWGVPFYGYRYQNYYAFDCDRLVRIYTRQGWRWRHIWAC